MQGLPEPPSPELISKPDALARRCDRWREQEAVALDTEFVRTRTFYPRLGLIQVGDAVGCSLVDTLAIDLDQPDDWRPFVELLGDPSVTKVLHSPSEDLEVFLHAFDALPEPLFDTQIAATLAGLGSSMGYPRLVDELFDIDLPKGEQRSDWLARPLTSAQIRYAGLDVAYLLPAWEILRDRLEQLDRTHWAEEEFARLPIALEARLDPEQIFQRLDRTSLAAQERATLRALVRWREAEARRRDLPRGFVLADDVVLEIARSRPESAAGLGRVKGLGRGALKRYASALLRLIAESSPTAADAAPRRGSSRGTRREVDGLRSVVTHLAEELDLPPEFLAPRRVLENVVRRHREGDEALPAELEGWREGEVADRLLAELERP